MKRKRLLALALVLLGAALLFLIFDKPPALPAVMFLPPGPLAVKSGRVPERWIPANWGWLHRTCQFFFGPPRWVGIDIQFIEVSDTAASIVAQNSLGPPQAESNGIAVWILPGGKLQQPKDAAINFIMPTMSSRTPDRMDGSVGATMGNTGYIADLFPRLDEEKADLSTRLIVTSAGQTNFLAAVRAQLYYGQALFVLDVRQPKSASNRMEFVITADEYDAKGNMVQKKAAGK
jgi:hypothetical protein